MNFSFRKLLRPVYPAINHDQILSHNFTFLYRSLVPGPALLSSHLPSAATVGSRDQISTLLSLHRDTQRPLHYPSLWMADSIRIQEHSPTKLINTPLFNIALRPGLAEAGT